MSDKENAKRDYDAACLCVNTIGPIVGQLDYQADWFNALMNIYLAAERAVYLIEIEYPAFAED